MRDVGFESGKMIGRGVSWAMARMISSVKRPGWPDTPINAVGRACLTTSSSEISDALRLSDEARQMAAQYETLQELVKLSSQRKKRRQSSRRKSHKKRRETIDAASGPRNSKRRLKRQNTMTRPMGE